MQTDILYKQLITKLEVLKTAVEKFQKHTPPSTAYAEQLHTAINEANKLVSAYLVLKEQKDVSPELNLHLKLMGVIADQTESKDQVKMELAIEKPIYIETPKEVVKPIEIIKEPIIEKKVNEIVSEKTEEKSYPKLTINLNDKFRFINELFGSNANEYNIALEQLNTVNSVDEAISYLKGLQAIYDWNDEHEMVKNLKTLVQKRFAS